MSKLEKKLILNRRSFLKNLFIAGGGIGMKSLLLGLPPSFITQRAFAAEMPTFLIFSTMASGDPVNCNIPGTYKAGMIHEGSFATPQNVNLGGQIYQAAAPWRTLNRGLRNRFQFFHHSTEIITHPEAAKFLRARGALVGESGNGLEMIPSAIASLRKPRSAIEL